MDGLRAQIQSLRQKNEDSKYFMPAGALNDLLKHRPIKNALKECGVEVNRIDEVTELIVRGGRRTFAILLAIYRQATIMKFVEGDQFQTNILDSKLPRSLSDLQSILPATDVGEFFERQWEFTAPVFPRGRGHRLLHHDTIFPFMASQQRGEGGFGRVFEVELHPAHGSSLGVSPGKVCNASCHTKESAMERQC